MSLYKGNNLISGVIPNSANQSLSNLNSAGQDKFDAKVNKSGDTMTGNLTILKDNGLIAEKSSFDSTTTTAPSVFTNLGILVMYDTNEHITGYVQNSFNTDNTVRTSIGARRIINGENKSATLSLNVDASGNTSCNFPNTTCCDGQWVALNQNVISSATSANGSSYLGPYTVNVPNDGYRYELLIEGQISTGSTIANWVALTIQTTATVITCVQVIAQRTAQIWGTGSCIIPINADRKLWVGRETSQNGNIQRVTVVAYRRIGTNS